MLPLFDSNRNKGTPLVYAIDYTFLILTFIYTRVFQRAVPPCCFMWSALRSDLENYIEFLGCKGEIDI